MSADDFMATQPYGPDKPFKWAQTPVMWFLNAQSLRDAAEIILGDQSKREKPYLEAADKAGKEAQAAAFTSSDGLAQAEIACESPNYGPAQLLYAFAMENALKGLIVIQNPGLIASPEISKSIKSHDLIMLARNASFQLAPQEEPVLKALSHIAEWAGRYPVPTKMDRYVNQENPLGVDRHALLEWGQHSVMRRCFDRMLQELEKEIQRKLGRPPSRFSSVFAFRC
jgi:hypothetical protein